jgi:GNAT superfamily N-acetyltransferase
MKKIKFKIRKFKEKQAKEVSKLIFDSFNEFVASDWSKRGKKKFLRDIIPEKIIKRSKSKIREYYVAMKDNKVIGIIGMKNNRINVLFVNKKFHKKGVATKLIKKIESIFKKRKTKIIKIRSSLCAVKFYEKMGYKKSWAIVDKGRINQPMKKN